MNTNEVQLLKHTNRLEIAKRANNRLFLVVSKVDVFFSTTGKRARSVCVCAARCSSNQVVNAVLGSKLALKA